MSSSPEELRASEVALKWLMEEHELEYAVLYRRALKLVKELSN